ncbi:hypothetical protein SK128_024504 [Halocaridina rubra]|uniref:Uncharacterized protein n=1 Tax=Halocaridina rubra TaxID=373956 RepID=A0AAN8WV69_HALRR
MKKMVHAVPVTYPAPVLIPLGATVAAVDQGASVEVGLEVPKEKRIKGTLEGGAEAEAGQGAEVDLDQGVLTETGQMEKPPPSINPCIDLDDLPLKLDTLTGSKERKEILNKKNRPDPDEIINLDSPKPILNEILISSDSENEVKASTKAKSVRVERRELVPSALETGGPTKSIKPALPELTKDLKNVNFVQNVSLDKELDRAVRKGISMDNNSSEKQSPKTDTVPITSKWPQNICDEAQEQCSKESESLEEQVEQSVSVDKKIIKNEGQDILAEDKGGNECEHSGINSSNEPHVNIETTSNTIVVESIPESSKRKADIVKEGKSDGKYTFTEANSDNAAFMNSESADKELESNSSRETSLKISYSREKKSVGKPYKTKGAKASRGKKNTLFNVDEVAKLQKVKLDHLQTSYDEEQQKIIEEPTKLTQDKSDDPINRVPEKIVEESTVLEQEKDVTKHMVSEQDCASDLEATSVRNVTSPLCKSALESDAIPLLSLKSCEESKELITDDDVKVSKILSEEENTEVIPNKEQYEEQIESKVNSKDGNNVDDFYRGADQLDLSDDDIDVEKAHEDFLQDDREVEPIRIETGLIRKRILHAKKSEWTAPGISWTKKEKKKREKPKDVLAMEGVGLLKTALAENIQSPISKDGEEEEFQSQDSSEGKVGDHGNDDDDTRASWGVPSSLSKVDTTSDLKVQSSREVNLKETSNINEDDRIAEVDEDLPQKRSGQDTEIIGVIGTIPDPDSEHIEGIDLGGSSWSMRWLQSEKVQKVVSSSKMLSRVRKKFQKKDKATKVVPVAKPEVIQKQLPDPVVPIIGSIEEYERLFGMRVKQPSGEETMGSTSVHESAPTSTGSAQANVTGERTAPQKKPAVFGSDDEGEDSEEEALWSKILGK